MLQTMKKVLFMLALLIVVAYISSCRKDDMEKFSAEEIEEYNFQQIPVTKINDYLFEVTNSDFYTSYIFNPYSVGDEFNGLSTWHGVCTGIRNGDLVGRNLDWECSEKPEFIVRIPADKDRHASIGICNSNMVKHAPLEGWLSQMLVNDISNNCFDGVNDCGVSCVSLVVHFADDIQETINGTNDSPTAFTLHCANVVRYILDKASSAKEGVELLKAANIYGYLGEYSFHWMICDERESYFVELIHAQVVATKVEENAIASFAKPIITNFYVLKELSEQKVPCGVERYNILEANYGNATSVQGMFETLEKVRYSRKYDGKDPSTLANGEQDPNWYSEFLAHMPNYDDVYGAPLYNEYPKDETEKQKLWETIISKDIERNAISKFPNPRKNPMSAWTCHSAVYNIKERSLQLVIGEEYNNIIPSASTSFKLDSSN